MATKNILLSTSAKIPWQKRQEPKMVTNNFGKLLSIQFIDVHNKKPDQIVYGVSVALAGRTSDTCFLLLHC